MESDGLWGGIEAPPAGGILAHEAAVEIHADLVGVGGKNVEPEGAGAERTADRTQRRGEIRRRRRRVEVTGAPGYRKRIQVAHARTDADDVDPPVAVTVAASAAGF